MTISRSKFRPGPKVRFRPRLKAGEMTQVEVRYDAYLAALKLMGKIFDYWPHKLTWRLSNGTHYRADFLILWPDGHLEIHETKAGKKNKTTGEWGPFSEEDALLKVKWVAEQCPIPIKVAFEAGKNNWRHKDFSA
jgi:hypothetical protein